MKDTDGVETHYFFGQKILRTLISLILVVGKNENQDGIRVILRKERAELNLNTRYLPDVSRPGGVEAPLAPAVELLTTVLDA